MNNIQNNAMPWIYAKMKFEGFTLKVLLKVYIRFKQYYICKNEHKTGYIEACFIGSERQLKVGENLNYITLRNNHVVNSIPIWIYI